MPAYFSGIKKVETHPASALTEAGSHYDGLVDLAQWSLCAFLVDAGLIKLLL